MKSKKGAFANYSTGYGKRNNTNSHKSTYKATKSPESSSTVKSNSNSNSKKFKKLEQEVEQPKFDDDDLNSGFGNYLRSNEGVEMLKIFVFANTVMVIVTFAWPHVKEQYIWLMEWLDSFRQA